MTKDLQKSSKRKQKLYDKFLKSKTNENENKYKTYKSLFEIFKEKSRKFYYARQLDSCEQNMKKTWDTIKEVIGKTKTFKNGISKSMVIVGIETFDQNKIVNGSTIFLLKSGLNLHLKSQSLPKISNSLWMSQKQCYRFILFKM